MRLKRYLEMRGADGGPWRRLPALPAFWVGLLYDDACLDAAWDLVKDWTAEERQKLRDDVPRLGFKATIRGRNLLDLARECLALARAGLTRRNRRDAGGADETRYLEPLELIVERGVTPAEELLEKFHGRWNGSVAPIYTRECAILEATVHSAARLASDRLSSDDTMCPASASASANCSCGLRTRPIRHDGKSGNPSAGVSTRIPGRNPDSGSTDTASPASTAAATAPELALEYSTR